MPSVLLQSVLRIAESRAVNRFLTLSERWEDNRPNLLRVLTYHRVDEPQAQPSLNPGLLSATPASFPEQMRWLAANCRVVSLGEVLEAAQGGRPLPPRSVLVTFDDAYRDFAEHAWPVLRSYGLPVVLFVPTAFPDQPQRVFWWDRLYHAIASAEARRLETPAGILRLDGPIQRQQAWRRLRDEVKRLPHDQGMGLVESVCAQLNPPPPVHHVLGWDELRRLASQGVTLAPHTRHHPLMHRVSADQAVAEAIGSLDDLRREIGQVPAVLAYPGGGVNDAVTRRLEEAGFQLALTTCRGLNLLPSADPLRLRRINVGRQTSLALLRVQLHAWSRWLNGCFGWADSAGRATPP